MKLIGVALNYKRHIEELNLETPKAPVLFMMPDAALLRNNDPFYFPDFTKEIHYEVELVVKISKVGKNVAPRFANRYYNEIGVGLDLTARDIQTEALEKGLPWSLAKGFDHASPIGKKFIKIADIEDVNNVNFSLKQNDKIVQQGNSGDMVFGIDELVSYISRFFTLKIGDLIYTGTPAGVGPIKIGDRLQAYYEDQKMLDFMVK